MIHEASWIKIAIRKIIIISELSLPGSASEMTSRMPDSIATRINYLTVSKSSIHGGWNQTKKFKLIEKVTGTKEQPSLRKPDWKESHCLKIDFIWRKGRDEEGHNLRRQEDKRHVVRRKNGICHIVDSMTRYNMIKDRVIQKNALRCEDAINFLNRIKNPKKIFSAIGLNSLLAVNFSIRCQASSLSVEITLKTNSTIINLKRAFVQTRCCLNKVPWIYFEMDFLFTKGRNNPKNVWV